jgi:hypothetical protein
MNRYLNNDGAEEGEQVVTGYRLFLAKIPNELGLCVIGFSSDNLMIKI